MIVTPSFFLSDSRFPSARYEKYSRNAHPPYPVSWILLKTHGFAGQIGLVGAWLAGSGSVFAADEKTAAAAGTAGTLEVLTTFFFMT
jgi:hypothetical protein